MSKPTGNPVGRKPRANIDWETAKAEYEVGAATLRDIGARCNVSEAAIRKKAKAEGWTRDLTAKIRLATEAELVRRECALRTEPEIIRAASVTRAEISERQRARIAGLTDLADKMMKRVRDLKLDQEIGDMVTASIAIGVLDKAATTTGKLIALERQTWNMDAPVEAGDAKTNACDDLMKRLVKLSEKG